MGNVNGREDGSSSPSGVEEGGNSVHEAMAAPMGLSPPHSPTATHSPLIFTPQVRYFYFSKTSKYFFLFLSVGFWGFGFHGMRLNFVAWGLESLI